MRYDILFVILGGFSCIGVLFLDYVLKEQTFWRSVIPWLITITTTLVAISKAQGRNALKKELQQQEFQKWAIQLVILSESLSTKFVNFHKEENLDGCMFCIDQVLGVFRICVEHSCCPDEIKPKIKDYTKALSRSKTDIKAGRWRRQSIESMEELNQTMKKLLIFK